VSIDIRLKKYISIGQFIKRFNKYNLQDIGYGYDNCIYLLFREDVSPKCDDAIYKIIVIDNDQHKIIESSRIKANYDFIRPIDKNEYLLISHDTHRIDPELFDDIQDDELTNNNYIFRKAGCLLQRARSENSEMTHRYFVDDGIDVTYAQPNAIILNHSGDVINKFLLGGAIFDVATTDKNNIWISYYTSEPAPYDDSEGLIGMGKLRKWDKSGYSLFRHEDNVILDCSDINVIEDDDIWVLPYIYADHILLNYHKGSIKYFEFPEIKKQYSSYGYVFLFKDIIGTTCYNRSNNDRNILIFRVVGENLFHIGTVNLYEQKSTKKDKVNYFWPISCRHSKFIFRFKYNLYIFDLRNINALLKSSLDSPIQINLLLIED